MNVLLAYQPPHYASQSSHMRHKNVAMTTTDPMSRASNIAPANEIIGISPQYASLLPRTRHEGDGQFLSLCLPDLDEEASQARLPEPLLIEPETADPLAAAQAPEVKGVEEMLHSSLHLFALAGSSASPHYARDAVAAGDSCTVRARNSIALRITPEPANCPSISVAPRGSALFMMPTLRCQKASLFGCDQRNVECEEGISFSARDRPDGYGCPDP